MAQVQTDSDDITSLLLAWRGGDESALHQLMPQVYRQLKEIAGHLIHGERQDHTLNATSLVHETYLRVGDFERIRWQDRAHFFAMCARVMRRILVDHARSRACQKRGVELQVDGLDLSRLGQSRAPQLVQLDDALVALAGHDAQMAHIVELRFFGGLDREDIAEVLSISSATVTRRWRAARAWLIHHLQPETTA